MVKKLKKGWIRDISQEKNDDQRGGSGSYRWYEKGDIIASLVDGNIVNEGEWRISGKGFDAIESRGDLHKMLKHSDEKNINKIESLIRREKFRK